MVYMAVWQTLSLTLYFYDIVEITSSHEANGSSPLSVLPVDVEYHHGENKNHTEFTGQSVVNFLISSRNISGTDNVSQKKIRSPGQNSDSFEGFEFVDSPDVPTDAPSDSTGKVTVVGVDRSNGGALGGSNGAIEKNLWKSYPNGTIIHDVHISLVHPANMVGVVKEVSSAPVESSESPSDKMKTDITRGERTSRKSNATRSVSYDGNTTITPLKSSFGDDDSSSIALNSSVIHSVNDSVIIPDTSIANRSDVDVALITDAENGTTAAAAFATGQTNLDGKFPPVINFGISINAYGPCLSECLSKCYVAGSNASINQVTSLPLCLSNLDDADKKRGDRLDETGKSLEGTTISDETNSSTVSVPVLMIDTKENALATTRVTIIDPQVAPDILLGMLKNKESPEPKLGFLLEDICLSEKCVLKAADVLRRMDKSADPCHSFYNFACGGYFKNEMPDGKSSTSVFSEISSDIISRLYSVLKSPFASNDYPYVKLLKRFYSKCIVTSPKELFMGAVEELGGWPAPNTNHSVPQHVWGEIAFNWTYGMFLEHNLVLINLTFTDDSRDKWILNVDYPLFVKVAMNSGLSVLDEMEHDMKIVASALGIDNSTTRSVLGDIKIFMTSAIRYAKATVSTAEKGVYSLKYLKAKFTHLDVLKKLPSLLNTAVAIDDKEMIYVNNMNYLQKVDDLLRDSPVRTQGAHLVLTALRILSLLIGTAADKDMEKYCVKLTGKLFPHLVGHLYSSTFVSNSKVERATRIVSRIRDSLLHVFGKSVDSTTKKNIIDKLRNLIFIWSNRNEVHDDLNGIASSFNENPSFLGFVKTGIWNLKKVTYAYLHQRVNSSLASFIERYSEDDNGVNAFYYSQHILIRSSALHESIFDPDVPPYVSFGGLGLIVGHELIHSVIAVGDLANSVNYGNMEKCMIDKFNKFAKKYSGDRVNGDLTKDENIADYGGFKVAYHAFMEWYNQFPKHSKETRLPGLQKFNEKQMFWLTAATNWCRKVSPNYVSTIDKHAPPEYRIDGQFANIPEFAQDFNCPDGSPMNPKEKCSLW